MRHGVLYISSLTAVIVLLATPTGSAEATTHGMIPAGSTSASATVTGIVDGDTIDTTAGRVRVIGIDTPENGQCNADKATAKAARLAPVGSTVKLTLPAGENEHDAYGRILRYVTRKGKDFGGAQIKAGLADARYDSLDGYPHHPKQSKYRRWDKKYPDKTCGSSGTATGNSEKKASKKYSGCRAYGPNGTSKDSKGRRYTKIDCRTRKPL